MTDKQIRDKLIDNGLKNAREWYPTMTKEELLTEYLGAKLFLYMLKDETNYGLSYQIEKVRLSLIKEVENNVKTAA